MSLLVPVGRYTSPLIRRTPNQTGMILLNQIPGLQEIGLFQTPRRTVFLPDESTYHKDEAETPASPQHAPTGLDPATDPPLVTVPEETSHHKDEAETSDSPQHTPTGLDPQANPPIVFVPDASSYHGSGNDED